MYRYIKKEDSSPLPGAAYIRYSSEMQSDSFSLDAQLRQIKEQAERDGVDIVKVFFDPAQSAYRKKFRPGINAMRKAARQGEFKCCMSTKWIAWCAGWNGLVLLKAKHGDRPRAAGIGYHLRGFTAALRSAYSRR